MDINQTLSLRGVTVIAPRGYTLLKVKYDNGRYSRMLFKFNKKR